MSESPVFSHGNLFATKYLNFTINYCRIDHKKHNLVYNFNYGL